MPPPNERTGAPPAARRRAGAQGASPAGPRDARRAAPCVPALRAAAAAATALGALALACGPVDVEARDDGPPPLPDVLVVLVDGLGVGDVGAVGRHLGLTPIARTPAFDTLAREGVVFTDLYAPSPWSGEALTAALSGLLPRSPAPVGTGAEATPWRPGLAEHLQRDGYATALVVGDRRLAPPGDTAPGFDDVVLVEGHDAEGGAPAAAVADAAIAWVAAHAGPQLVVCALADPAPPHHVYPAFAPEGGVPGPPGRVPSGLSHSELLRRAPEFDAADRSRLAALHASEVGAADDAFSRIAGALTARRDEPPVLAVAGLRPPALGADGGEVGLVPSLEPSALRVPLLVRFPAAFRGREAPVGVSAAHGSLVDLGPTLLDALGFAPRGDVEGRSLFPGAPLDADRVIVARTWRGVEGEARIGAARAELDVRGPGEPRSAAFAREAGRAAPWGEVEPPDGGER